MMTQVQGWVVCGMGLALGMILIIGVGCEERRRGGGGGGGGGGSEGEGEGEVPRECNSPPECGSQTCSGHGCCKTAGGKPVCVCDPGYKAVDLSCISTDPCTGVDCEGHGVCEVHGGSPYCVCDEGFQTEGPHCLNRDNPCAGQACSGKGICKWANGVAVCVCAKGYTPSSLVGLDCVPTEKVCTGGRIDPLDYNDDGKNETTFDPLPEECEMFELINWTRATHFFTSEPECRKPLLYDRLWSAHGRHHGKQMFERGELYHEDFPGGQNVAFGCDPACEMDMYMNGPNEPHCPAQSHHCNIMNCGYTHVGVGTYQGTWNTQNFY